VYLDERPDISSRFTQPQVKCQHSKEDISAKQPKKITLTKFSEK